jgi:hypothetical protein
MPKSLKRIQVPWDGIFVLALLAVAALSMSCSHGSTATLLVPVFYAIFVSDLKLITWDVTAKERQ